MSDPIPPPTASRPEETVELVSLAVSDGDLETALAQYEPGAVLQPWASQSASGTGPVANPGPSDGGGSSDGDDAGGSDFRQTLGHLMQLRLPLSVQVRAVLPARDLALVLGERQLAATGPDPRPIRLRGLGSTVVRRQPDGCWRIVAEAWCLDGPGAAEISG